MLPPPSVSISLASPSVEGAFDQEASARRRRRQSPDERKDQTRFRFHQSPSLTSITPSSLVEFSSLDGTWCSAALEGYVGVAATGVTVGVGPN